MSDNPGFHLLNFCNSEIKFCSPMLYFFNMLGFVGVVFAVSLAPSTYIEIRPLI